MLISSSLQVLFSLSSASVLFSLSFASEFQCEFILYIGYLYQCISSCLKFSSASHFMTCKEQSVKYITEGLPLAATFLVKKEFPC